MPSFTSIVAFAVLLALGSAVNPRLTSARPAPRDPIDKRGNGCPGINPLGGSIPNNSIVDGQPGGCPDAVNHQDPDGVCRQGMKVGGVGSIGNQYPMCAAYCEVRNYFFYDREVPFKEFSSCRANEPCSFTSQVSVTITKTYDFNVNMGLKKREGDAEAMDMAGRALEARDDSAAVSALKIAFSAGASYSYSVARSSSTSLSLTRPTNTMDKCGYWTFVPIMWTSCGTLTSMQAAIHQTGPFGNPISYNCNMQAPMHTVQNWCQTSPYLDNHGNVAGATVFVLIDCASNLELPKAQQDPIYQYDGVSDTQLP